jgi:hypothetical protein
MHFATRWRAARGNADIRYENQKRIKFLARSEHSISPAATLTWENVAFRYFPRGRQHRARNMPLKSRSPPSPALPNAPRRRQRRLGLRNDPDAAELGEFAEPVGRVGSRRYTVLGKAQRHLFIFTAKSGSWYRHGHFLAPPDR